MRTPTQWKKTLAASLAILGLCAASHHVIGKCQADLNACTVNVINGGTPPACNTHTETWAHGSCTAGFSNYQCDLKCVGNNVQKTNVYRSYNPVYTNGTVSGCTLKTNNPTQVTINCPQNVACDNNNGCE